jgi:FixJ family two-component response regulator
MNLAQVVNHQLELVSVANATPIIFAIVDDISVRNSLEALIDCEGWQVETFAAAREFLAQPRPLVPSCLILALTQSDPNTLEVQKQLSRERGEVPIVVISGHADVPTTVRAMKAGAVDVLLNPFSNELLLEAIRESLERSRKILDREMETHETRSRYESLSRRERQVMSLVVSGLLNKQVGGKLGIAEVTVKAHRGQVMQKMKANTVADLMRMAAQLKPAHQQIHLA